VDALIDRLSRSIDPGEQLSTHGEFLHEVTTDTAFMLLDWEVLTVLTLKGVKGNKVVCTTATWNFFARDRA
jgi:hypothetical protein